MQTVYETYQGAWDDIRKQGFPHLVEMTKQFTNARELETALGYGTSCVTKWVRKRGGVSQMTEVKAQNWIERHRAPQPKAKVIAGGEMLIVVCPSGSADKARRMLQLLGCEVENL